MVSRDDHFIIKIKDNDNTMLEFPPFFYDEFGSTMPENVKFRVGLNGKVFRARVVDHDGKLSVVRGWQEIAEAYGIERGYQLEVVYNRANHFEVTIFDKRKKAVDYPHLESKKHSGTVAWLGRDRITSPQPSWSTSGDETSYSDEVVFLKEITPKGKGSGGSSSNVAARMNKNSSTKSGRLSLKGRPPIKGKTHGAYQLAKARAGTGVHCILIMQWSYVNEQYQVAIPKDFAATEIGDNDKNITLRVAGTNDSPIVTVLYQNRLGRVSSGWKEFVVEHDLEYGDVLLVEVDPNDRTVWNATIFKDMDD